MGIHIMPPLYEKLIKPTEKRFEHLTVGDEIAHEFRDNHWEAQSFVPSHNHKITKVTLKLARSATFTGTVIIGVRDCNQASGRPVDAADLCSGSIAASSLPIYDPPAGDIGEWFEIDLGAGYNLVKSIEYGIVVRRLGADGLGYWRLDMHGGYIPIRGWGCAFHSDTSGAGWTTFGTYDHMFEEWGVS